MNNTMITKENRVSVMTAKVALFILVVLWVVIAACITTGCDVSAQRIEQLSDPNASVRQDAARELGNYGHGPEVVEALSAALKDEDPKVGKTAAVALGKIGGARAVESLIAALRDDKIGGTAAYALGKIGDAKAVEPLIAAVKNKDSGVWRSAIEALGRIGDKRAITVLVPFLRDWSSDFSRGLAADSLVQLGWQPETAEERVRFHVGREDADTLRRMWDQTKRVLLGDVDSGEFSRMNYGLYTFIQIGEEEIIPVLIDKLNDTGDRDMAEAYLNCGHEELSRAAREWARTHGYQITIGPSASPVTWGSW